MFQTKAAIGLDLIDQAKAWGVRQACGRGRRRVRFAMEVVEPRGLHVVPVSKRPFLPMPDALRRWAAWC